LAEPLSSSSDDDYRQIGPLRLKIPLFNIYLNEADELSRRLTTELAEWALELHRPVGESAVAAAHSLAGNSATVGFSALSHLARELEHALQRSDEIGKGEPEDAALFSAAGDEIRHLLHQFAAGFLRDPPPELAQQLNDWQHRADQLLLARLASNSVMDSRIDAPSTLSPELGLMPAEMPFDPASLPDEVADTGWQREADSPLPPPLGTPTDNAAFMAGEQPAQSHWWEARPAAPAVEPVLAGAAPAEPSPFDVDFDLDALAPPSAAGLLPELPDFEQAAESGAESAAATPANELPAVRFVTLADLALPVPEVVKPLSEDEAAAHFDAFTSSLVPKVDSGAPIASDWTADISFDLPSEPAAAPAAPPRRRELSEANATELMFPTIPGNEIELVVDGKLQPPPAPPPPREPAHIEPSAELPPEPSPEAVVTPDISLDLFDSLTRQSTELRPDDDDSRPVAGEDLLDIDLFEPAPDEEPYSEPLTQMADLPIEPMPSTLAPTLGEMGDALENLDQDLFPVFEEEALDLLPVLTQQLQTWRNYPSDPGPGTGCMRTLHTFKGGARLAGAMRLGELAHAMEATIENILGADLVDPSALAALQPQSDKLVAAFESLRSRFNAPRPTGMSAFGGLSGMVPLAGDSRMGPVSSRAMPFADSSAGSGRITVEPLVPSMPMPLDDEEGAIDEVDLVIEPAVSVAWRASQLGTPADLANARSAGARQPVVPVLPEPIAINWAELVGPPATATSLAAGAAVSTLPVRVRPQLLDRLVNLAGEVSITRARLESEVGQMRGSLVDLGENLDRLNQQLRDVALQAETQLESRMEAARALSQAFDPLELDRYTRLQELTRMMAESVNDVATVRSTLQRTVQTTEDELAMQGRLTRELQGDLLRTRMLEFDSLSERLQRVVRQAAAESGKQTRLDIAGGSIEVDRGVLDRMTPAFEHLLRNCVGHGIEYPETRAGAGKDPTGSIVITVQQEGNEVSVEIRDDGAGLDLLRIRDKALAMGLLSPDALPTEQALAQLILAPGLSTAGQLTELSGRGVGMDVVRSDVQALGGRIEIHTQSGLGTRFKLVLPLTTVVTQVVLLRAGGTTIAVPSHLIELVQRASSASLQQAYASGTYLFGGMSVPFYWLGALLESSGSGSTSGRTRPVIIVRSAQQRVALHVDEVQGNQEVVVKNLGAQLSRLPGLAGLTLLASGGVALIYNPVALATVYGALAHDNTRIALTATQDGQPVPTAPELAPPAPLVLVVDDSLTVRRVTRRLLEREGWRVAVAKDGMEALESLANERPVLVLSDIEMPRMDGFDLLRNIRADAQFGDLPVIMITSRIAQKHREHALQLGANHYLGKPYAEEELLALVRSYAKRASRTA
jgi:chemotaxis protein histidine kinase CheA/ActR/RegA family two-component response regulator